MGTTDVHTAPRSFIKNTFFYINCTIAIAIKNLEVVMCVKPQSSRYSVWHNAYLNVQPKLLSASKIVTSQFVFSSLKIIYVICYFV